MAARGTLAPDESVNNGPARGQLFAFFAGEVLARMPSDDADTLACIAFLPSTTQTMAASISGDSRAGLLLADLAARNLCTPFTPCLMSSCARTRRPR